MSEQLEAARKIVAEYFYSKPDQLWKEQARKNTLSGAADGSDYVQLVLRALASQPASEPSDDHLTHLDDDGEAMVCEGCGSTKSMDALRRKPGILSCCPERKMKPARDYWRLRRQAPSEDQVERIDPSDCGMDGMLWAKAFCQRFPSVELDDALGWFCNAIMAGYDTARNKYDPEAIAALRAAQAAPAPAGGWNFDMNAAPKGEITDDVGCRGASEWFLGKPRPKYKSGAPCIVIHRRPWPQDDNWSDADMTYYVPDYFIAWSPLPTAPQEQSQ